ncbi:MAG: chloride channel protein [Gammaproteobacteria bacterium]|nr:chloride channel protein [Gammaproteobacteria bacterium]
MVSRIPFGTLGYRIAILSLLALVVGSLASLSAIAFIETVGWLNDVLLISPRSRVQVQNPLLLSVATVMVPMLGGLLVGIVIQRYSDEQRPLGPPDAIRAAQLRTPLPSARSGIVSTLAAIVSIGSGASVGQYGPMVYMGAIAGNLVSKLKLSIANLPTIAIACGVAAAISTAFNAPIAGLVFAHEVILRHYSLQAFAPTTVAAATGYVIANIIFDRPALFLVEFGGVGHSYEFALFALIGFVCAFLSVGFMRLIFYINAVAPKLPLPAKYQPALAGLMVGVVALQLPDVLGLGQETLRFATIEGAFESWELILLVLAKMGLTALCIGLGFAGGVFSPSLLIGILFGAFSWTLLELIGVPNSGVIVYAICGMMALTSPVIGAPLTTILIVFELTHNYDLTISAMVAVVFANLLAFRLMGRSMFDVALSRAGVDLSLGRDRAVLEHTKIINLAINDFVRVDLNDSTQMIIDKLIRDGRSEAAVVDSKGIYQGIVRIVDLLGQESNSIPENLYADSPVFDEGTTLWQGMSALEGFVGEAVPIVSRTDARLIGMIAESELITAYQKISRGLRSEENEAV